MTQQKTSVAKYLAAQIDACDLSQKEIARSLGYPNPNIITMFKQGSTKLPLNKVGPMAKTLNADPIYLLRLVLEEYVPETWAALHEIVGKSLVSDDEMHLLQIVRANTAGHELRLDTTAAKTTFGKTIQDLVAAQMGCCSTPVS